MKRDYKLRIQDILDCINMIESYIRGKTENNFYEDFQLQDSVMRRLEIIGEATKHVSSVIREKYPEIPWKKSKSSRYLPKLYHIASRHPELVSGSNC